MSKSIDSNTAASLVTVVYRGENGQAWSRNLADWHRSLGKVMIKFIFLVVILLVSVGCYDRSIEHNCGQGYEICKGR